MRAQPDASVFSVSQNDCAQPLPVPAMPGAGQAGRLADRAGAAIGQPRGGSDREGVSRQDHRDAGLSVDAARRRSTMRPRPNVHRRGSVRSSAASRTRWPRATARRTGRSAPTSRLVQGRPAALGLGLRDRFPPLPAAVSRTSGCVGPNIRFFAAHNVTGIFEQDTYDTPDRRAGRAGRLPDGQVPLEPELRRQSGDRRVPRRLLRQGGRADPRLPRPAPRPRRAGKHPRGRMRGIDIRT